MQILVSLPGLNEDDARRTGEQLLGRKVCGIPLLSRVLATASRSGGTEALLLHSKSLEESWLKAALEFPVLSSIPMHVIALDKPFDPDNPSDWQMIENQLQDKFLWLPWNYVTDRRTLRQLINAGSRSSAGVRLDGPKEVDSAKEHGQNFSQPFSSAMPAIIIKEKLKRFAAHFVAESAETNAAAGLSFADVTLDAMALPHSAGVLVHSRQTARQAERELVRRSGKDTDGIYSKSNRWLCRPAVRWLSKTPVTPNMVSFTGLAVAFLSCYWFAQGHWSAYLLGASLYFVSVLIDEIDGMLARLTFRESAFGCWLETYVDYATYLLLFVGMTIGLYRESGARWLSMGGLLLFGTLTSFVVVSRQRKLATDPSRPNEYLGRIHRRLEEDSGNLLSRFGRLTEFAIRKAAFGYWVIIFTALGGLKVLFSMSAFGSSVVWLLALSYNRLFRPTTVRATIMKGAREI